MLDAYRDLITINPRNIGLRMKLADEYIGLGKMRGARIQLQEITTLYREEGNHEEVSNVERLIGEITPAIDTNGEDYWERAKSAEESGEIEKSVEYYYKAVGQFLGQVAYHLARDAFSRITELKPEELKPWQKLVQIGNVLGDKDGVVRAYSGLADALAQRGAADSAAAVYEKILLLEPENEDARRALTPTVHAPEGGEEVVEEEVQQDSREIVQEAPTAATEASVEEEFPELAVTGAGKPVFKVADEVLPDQPIGLDDLISEFKRGVEEYIGDDDYSTHYDLGVSFKEMGRIDEAIAHFEKAAEGAKEKLKAYELLGRCYIEKEDFETATDCLKKGLVVEGFSQSEYLGLRYHLGIAYEALRRNDDALKEYRMIESEDPQYFDTPERIERLSTPPSRGEDREEKGETDRKRDKIFFI
jgi:tetratricopeptide (TPR) repeat protein